MAAAVEYMGVNLRGRNILVAKQFLHRADIVAGFQQMRGEAVAPMSSTT